MGFSASFCTLPSDPFLLLAAFPRGPGFYFDPIKLALVAILFFIWVRTCWWVDHDCKEVDLPTNRWTPAVLAAGLLGLLLVWALPFFWVSFLVLVLLYLAPTIIYVGKRNEKVEDEEKVFTRRHLKKVLRRMFGGKKELAEQKQKLIPIRFIGKSNDRRGEDAGRVKRAQESQYYRRAQEMVYGAVVKRATDIHLEPTQDEMTVRLRIDGILEPGDPMSREEGDAVLNIFKVLADMDITEKRKPQDGSFSAEVQSVTEMLRKDKSPLAEDDGGSAEKVVTRQVDFRVATAGSVEGEKMVMRILDRSRAINDLARQIGRAHV